MRCGWNGNDEIYRVVMSLIVVKKIFIILKFIGCSKMKIWGILLRLVRLRVLLRHDLQSCVVVSATGGLLVSM